MLNRARYAFFLVEVVIVAMLTGTLGACSRQEPAQTSASAQGTVPPPPGDSTPKAVDSNASTAVPANERPGTANPSSQSTTGTAASGLPPYSVGSAPEGNPQSQAPRDPNPGASTAPNTSNPPSVAPNAPAPSTTSTDPNK